MGSMATILAVVTLYLCAASIKTQAVNLNEHPDSEDNLKIKVNEEVTAEKNPGVMKRSPQGSNNNCNGLQSPPPESSRRSNNHPYSLGPYPYATSEPIKISHPKVELLKSLYNPPPYERADSFEVPATNDSPLLPITHDNPNAIDRSNELLSISDSPVYNSGKRPTDSLDERTGESKEYPPNILVQNVIKNEQPIGAEQDILLQKKIFNSLKNKNPTPLHNNCNNVTSRSGAEENVYGSEPRSSYEQNIAEAKSGSPYNIEPNSRRFLSAPSKQLKSSGNRRVNPNIKPPSTAVATSLSENNEVNESNERFGDYRPLLLANSGRICYACSTITSTSCLHPDSKRTTVKYCLKGHDNCIKKSFNVNGTEVVIRNCASSCRAEPLQPFKTKCTECYSDLCNGAFSLNTNNILYTLSIMFIVVFKRFI